MGITHSDEFDTRPLKYARYTTVASNGGNNIVKATPGFLHSVTFAQTDAAPTAGTITIYDNNTIYGSVGSVVFTHSQTTAVFMPTTVILDIPLSTGLSIGFTTTNDVGVTLSYK